MYGVDRRKDRSRGRARQARSLAIAYPQPSVSGFSLAKIDEAESAPLWFCGPYAAALTLDLLSRKGRKAKPPRRRSQFQQGLGKRIGMALQTMFALIGRARRGQPRRICKHILQSAGKGQNCDSRYWSRSGKMIDTSDIIEWLCRSFIRAILNIVRCG